MILSMENKLVNLNELLLISSMAKKQAFSHNSLLKDCKKAKFAMKEEIYLLFYNDNLKCELKLNIVQRDGG